MPTHPASFANAPKPEANPAWDPRRSAEPSPSPSYSPPKAEPERSIRMVLLAPTALPCPAASERAAALPIWERQEGLPPRKAASEQRALWKVVWERGAPLLKSKAAWARRVARTAPQPEGPSERKKGAPTAWEPAEMRAALPQKPIQARQVSA